MAEGKHEIASIEISPAENGGHTVKHRFKTKPTYKRGGPHAGMSDMYREPEEHVFGKGQDKAMLAHVGKHLGIAASSERHAPIGASVPAQTDEGGD